MKTQTHITNIHKDLGDPGSVIKAEAEFNRMIKQGWVVKDVIFDEDLNMMTYMMETEKVIHRVECNKCGNKFTPSHTYMNGEFMIKCKGCLFFGKSCDFTTVKSEIIEMLLHLYEVDIDNCTMTSEMWIKQVAEAITNPQYLVNLQNEYKEYLSERQLNKE